MGIGLFRKSCWTNSAVPPAELPNPSPSRWTLIKKKEFNRGYVLKVRYHDCTNFEGVKIMVYRGEYKPKTILDPHFDSADESLIARFRPTEEGWRMAVSLAASLQ